MRFAIVETDCQRQQRMPRNVGLCPVISGKSDDVDTKTEKVKLK